MKSELDYPVLNTCFFGRMIAKLGKFSLSVSTVETFRNALSCDFLYTNSHA